MTRVLVAHPNVDMFELIKDGLDDEFGNAAPEVLYSKNRVEVVERCRADLPHLVIAYIDLGEDRRTSVQPGKGLELVTQLRTTYPHLPCILMAPSATGELSRAVQSLANVPLILEGSRLEEHLRMQARTALEQSINVPRETAGTSPAAGRGGRRPVPAPRPEPERFVIDMRLRLDGQCSYTSRSVGGKVPYHDDKRFNVDPRILQELITESKALQEAQNWNVGYEALGKKLRDVLLRGNLEVSTDIAFVRGLMYKDDPNAMPSIRFIVEAGIHSIALESLLDDQGDFWMQRAPIWRQLDLRRGAYPIYQDVDTREDPVNCLIIESDSEGDALESHFARLAGVHKEVVDLDQHLRDQPKGSIGKIGRIWRDEAGVVRTSTSGMRGKPRPSSPRGSFRTALRDFLTGDTVWHIVHYVGHSLYDAEHDRGYVLLPGAPMEVVGASELAGWMSRTRFVYMSSCSGSSQDFVFNLCKCNVPAVAGFRYRVDDESATSHSRTFYTELLARRSLEGALFSTWNHMYGTYRHDRIWASSELVIQ